MPYELCQVDLLLESGEYFLSDQKKQAKKWQEKQEKQEAKVAETKRKREEAFVPPEVCIGTPFCVHLCYDVFLCLIPDSLYRNLAKKFQRIPMTVMMLLLLHPL